MKNGNEDIPPNNLASCLRGLYGRVADRLRVDPSYVSRVARGERKSEEIEAALLQEMRAIMRRLKTNPRFSRRRALSRKGPARNGARGRIETGRRGQEKRAQV
jgi:hypothetical protein